MLRQNVIEYSADSTGFSKNRHNPDIFPETFSEALKLRTFCNIYQFLLASKFKNVENAVFLTCSNATRLCNENISSKFA